MRTPKKDGGGVWVSVRLLSASATLAVLAATAAGSADGDSRLACSWTLASVGFVSVLPAPGGLGFGAFLATLLLAALALVLGVGPFSAAPALALLSSRGFVSRFLPMEIGRASCRERV